MKEVLRLLDLIIKNGIVVNADSTQQCDIAIKDEKIVSLGKKEYFPKAKKIIDAEGKYVMPGMIDSHVHVNLKVGEFCSLDNFTQASLGALHGGITTMIEFASPLDNETSLEALERRLEEAKVNTRIDYSFHGVVTKVNGKSLQDIKEMLNKGISSIKMFTVYDGVMLDMGEIREVLKTIGDKGLALFHAEDNDIISSLINKYKSQEKTSPIYHSLSRPPITEELTMASLIMLIEETKTPSLFVHMSTGRIQNLIKNARKKMPLFIETCSHYLTLSEDVYTEKNSERFICSPPLRSRIEQDRLWEMIKKGLIDTINSDHLAYDTLQKEKYKNMFPKIPNGLPGIETNGIIFFSEAVSKGKITPNQFVNLTSTKTSKIMGIYQNKGKIDVGFDADIIILDQNKKWKISNEKLHMQTDYTPFEGLQLKGKIDHTIIRGHHLIENAELIDDQFRGNFIKRNAPLTI